MLQATQIADWFVDYQTNEGAPVDPMSLEKHLYYAQGFSLGVRREALFSDPIEAWKYGPVVNNVWSRYSGVGHAPILTAKAPPPELEPATEEFLCQVADFLSPFPALQLSRATHKEAPWVNAFAKPKFHPFDNNPISVDAMRDWFGSLIEEGEEALSRHAMLDVLPEPHWGWLYIAGICTRSLVDHPFFVTGTSLWKAKLSDMPIQADPFDVNLYRPPTRADASGRADFANLDEYLKSRA